MSSLKEKTFSGAIWSAVERFSSYGLQFVFSILMARLLSPSDYGTIALLNVFFAICQTFIDSGFNLAIIRKQDRTEDDFSTAFVFSMTVAIASYLLLWLGAPYIASFYDLPILKQITRIISFNLVISTISSMHNAKLSICLDFLSKAKISIFAVVGSCSLGLSMAYAGYGVWALVAQVMTASLIRSLLLFYYVRWIPRMRFSSASFKSMFSFGSKMLVSGLIGNIYNNLYSIVIGKVFTPSLLGVYSKAESFATLPSLQMSGVILSVSYPSLAKIQDDNVRLIEAYKKISKLSSFIIFPLMIGLAALSDPLIRLLLGEKWEGVIILLQILCFSYIWDPFNSCNMNLLQLKGYSALYLKLEIIKKVLGLAVLVATLPFGIKAMCVGKVFLSLISLPLNTHYAGKLYNYGLLPQLKDLIPLFLHALMMGAIILTAVYFVPILWLKLVIGFIVGVVYYISVAIFFKMPEYLEIFELIQNFVRSK
jgi:O-antigen/teichoic acid export membrane protein